MNNNEICSDKALRPEGLMQHLESKANDGCILHQLILYYNVNLYENFFGEGLHHKALIKNQNSFDFKNAVECQHTSIAASSSTSVFLDNGVIIENEKEKISKLNKIVTRSSIRNSPVAKSNQSSTSSIGTNSSKPNNKNVQSSNKSNVQSKIPKKRKFQNIKPQSTKTFSKKRRRTDVLSNGSSKNLHKRNADDGGDFFISSEGKRYKKVKMLPDLNLDSDGKKMVNDKVVSKNMNRKREIIILVEGTQLEDPIKIEDSNFEIEQFDTMQQQNQVILGTFHNTDLDRKSDSGMYSGIISFLQMEISLIEEKVRPILSPLGANRIEFINDLEERNEEILEKQLLDDIEYELNQKNQEQQPQEEPQLQQQQPQQHQQKKNNNNNKKINSHKWINKKNKKSNNHKKNNNLQKTNHHKYNNNNNNNRIHNSNSNNNKH